MRGEMQGARAVRAVDAHNPNRRRAPTTTRPLLFLARHTSLPSGLKLPGSLSFLPSLPYPLQSDELVHLRPASPYYLPCRLRIPPLVVHPVRRIPYVAPVCSVPPLPPPCFSFSGFSDIHFDSVQTCAEYPPPQLRCSSQTPNTALDARLIAEESGRRNAAGRSTRCIQCRSLCAYLRMRRRRRGVYAADGGAREQSISEPAVVPRTDTFGGSTNRRILESM
ncbi:hypothetical protein FB451DRAFT_1387211 [Mycena latifolia]|nr:hypothetical protein FB451DRAFT_1387211 [Mycena latifolia]